MYRATIYRFFHKTAKHYAKKYVLKENLPFTGAIQVKQLPLEQHLCCPSHLLSSEHSFSQLPCLSTGTFGHIPGFSVNNHKNNTFIFENKKT